MNTPRVRLNDSIMPANQQASYNAERTAIDAIVESKHRESVGRLDAAERRTVAAELRLFANQLEFTAYQLDILEQRRQVGSPVRN